MRLAWAVNPSRACELVMPNRHALVETYHPQTNKDAGHVVVEGLEHLSEYIG
jgi:hypothetical protein